MKTFADFGIDRARSATGRFESEARANAQIKGLKRYESGRPCPSGHVGERFVSNCGCVQCLLDQNKKNHAKNKTARNARSREYAKQKPSENRERSNASRYKSTRVPPWADRDAVQEFYRNCPAGMVVDHQIPLKGKFVSGLHVLENLQYLTPTQNAMKGAS